MDAPPTAVPSADLDSDPPPADWFRFPGERLVNAYALKAWRRAAADVFYLRRWHELGHAEAARLTCERFDHDVRGGLCERCGLPVTGQRAARSLQR